MINFIEQTPVVEVPVFTEDTTQQDFVDAILIIPAGGIFFYEPKFLKGCDVVARLEVMAAAEQVEFLVHEPGPGSLLYSIYGNGCLVVTKNSSTE